MLDSQQHNSEVKEQALCIIGNIAACMHEREYVMEDENILIKLKDYLVRCTTIEKYNNNFDKFLQKNFLRVLMTQNYKLEPFLRFAI